MAAAAVSASISRVPYYSSFYSTSSASNGSEPISQKILEIVRTHMPITSIFNPKLKIDLGVFIRDQILIREIAHAIAPFVNQSVSEESVAKSLVEQGIDAKIKVFFPVTSEFDQCWKLLIKACISALKGKGSDSKILSSAISGRICTLKNALTAQREPSLLHKSQRDHKLAPHSLMDIQNEGMGFICESIRLHLSVSQKSERMPFQEILQLNAEALAPFVRDITTQYLLERGQECPEDPLSFRDPTGYNHHGLVAATVMEVCLSALGFKTDLKLRCDLEPKVTLATAHAVIEVTDSEGSKYIVDPSFKQFYKDIPLDERSIPKHSVLVLKDSETDAYADSNLFAQWKKAKDLFEKGDAAFIKKMEKEDQLLPFIISQVPKYRELIPDIESWVQKALRRIWDLSSYQDVSYNSTVQEIFAGNRARKVHDTVRAMGLLPLTRHLTVEEVEKRLGDSSNSLEVISLISQLPDEARARYVHLLDTDARLNTKNGLKPGLNAYFRSLKKSLSPIESAVYGCSGADCMSILLATDAKDITFVDLTPLTLKSFQEELEILKQGVSLLIEGRLEESSYISRRSDNGGGVSKYNQGQHEMPDLPLKLLYDLRQMGVSLNLIKIESVRDGIKIDFPWSYDPKFSATQRSITLIRADITKPHTYPPLLKQKLEKGIDAFYMKAAFQAPKSYPEFLPYIARCIKLGGYLMTSDKTNFMETVNPEKCLEKSCVFQLQKSEETKKLEVLLVPQFNPMRAIPVLRDSPDRLGRNTGSDHTYWSLLNIRRKIA